MSFDYPFSRDFNYVFELDLSQMGLSGGNDYMYNTDSDFLTNYLSSKLIDKYGDPVTPGSARFGFMFRSSENEVLSSLSAYMPINKPGDKHEFTSGGQTKYYPSNSIVFRIENPKGANVSVVGNGQDITIYGYDPKSPANDVTPLYTMKSINTKTEDMHRYFKYTLTDDPNTSGHTTTHCENYATMSDDGALYGHIFRLPQGDYVLGSYSNSPANIYFLAVQGQTEGTIGAKETIAIEAELDDVSFLLEEPLYMNYPAGFNKALFTYKGVFNTTHGTIYNDVYEAAGNKYMRVTFNNSPIFVTSLKFRSRLLEHIFMVNGSLYDMEEYTYTPT